MSLHTYEVPWNTGRVRFINSESKHLTIECPDLSVAFGVVCKRRVQVGDWVRFRGSVRLDPTVKKNGELAEHVKYWHNPFFTTACSWIFFEIVNPELVMAWSPEEGERLHHALLCIRRQLDSRATNDSSKTLLYDVQMIESALDVLLHRAKIRKLEELDMNGTVRTIDVKID